MPLKKGPGSVSYNIHELTTGPVGKSRKKAIATYAKKKGISKGEAKHKLAYIIARKQVQKRPLY